VGKSNSFGNSPVEMAFRGTCGNCSGLNLNVYDVPTFLSTEDDEDVVSRRFLWSSSTLPRRKLQEDTAYSYPAQHPIANRAPYEAKFVHAYQEAMAALNLECISTLAQCELVPLSIQGL
jgi:hypothetical protein